MNIGLHEDTIENRHHSMKQHTEFAVKSVDTWGVTAMSEATFTYRLTSALRKRLPDATVIKLADAYTAGLPDFFISLNGQVTFFEVKLTINKEIFRPIQLATLEKLVRGAYIVWDEPRKKGDVFWHEDRDFSLLFSFKELIEEVVKLVEDESR